MLCLSFSGGHSLNGFALVEIERKRLQLIDDFEFDGQKVSVGQVIELFGNLITRERMAKIERVVQHRRLDFFTVMENIYDRGNVSAVMRTGEAFGLIRFLLIEPPGSSFKAANRVTRGADKWLDTQVVGSTKEALSYLKTQGVRVLASSLKAEKTLDQFDLTQPTALVIGNEKEGISEEMAGGADTLFFLPMKGFSQSFNLSVASALCFAEVNSQAQKAGRPTLTKEQESRLVANYILRSLDRPERLVEQILKRSESNEEVMNPVT